MKLKLFINLIIIFNSNVLSCELTEKFSEEKEPAENRELKEMQKSLRARWRLKALTINTDSRSDSGSSNNKCRTARYKKLKKIMEKRNANKHTSR